MAVTIDNKSSLKDYIHGIHFHAGQILGLEENPISAGMARVTLNQHPERFPLTYVYNNNSWDWSTHNIHIYNPAPSSSSKPETEKDKKQKDASLIMWAGIFGSAVCTFIFAKTFKTLSGRLETLALTEDVQLQLKHAQHRANPIFTDLSSLVHSYSNIIQAECNKSRTYVLAAGLALSGFLGMAAGGYLIIPVLMSASKVAVFVAALGCLGNCGYYWDETDLKKEAYKIIGYTGQDGSKAKGLIEKVERQFFEYDDQMVLHSFANVAARSPKAEEAEGYVPLYPNPPAYNPAYVTA